MDFAFGVFHLLFSHAGEFGGNQIPIALQCFQRIRRFYEKAVDQVGWFCGSLSDAKNTSIPFAYASREDSQGK